ncbi:MAG: DUF3795 domain-containing protein [Massiliimalia sp.]|jgi:hypothetical protein
MLDDGKLIAPCGMNCALCQAYQGKGLPCYGCGNGGERKSCKNCTIANCNHKDRFCFECEQYPCKRLSNLDKRYREKYHMSMLKNLEEIKADGIDAFLKHQKEKYTCPVCGQLVSVHRSACIYCELEKNTKKKI